MMTMMTSNTPKSDTRYAALPGILSCMLSRTVAVAVLAAAFCAPAFAQAHAATPLNDGPYAFYQQGNPGLEVKWICNDQELTQSYPQRSHLSLPAKCAYPYPIEIREPEAARPAVVRFTAKKIAAFSDIHGQFGLMTQLLQANRIIDDKGQWQFGDGHLVLTGDVFDRGPQVTEALWMLYALEAQAKKAGGDVHLLLGNHETMALSNDLRYVNPKYLEVARRFNKTYPELFSNDSVLGQWLRSRPVIVQVNDMLFMHGGLHPDYLNLKLSVAETNEKFRASLGLSKAQVKTNDVLAFLYGSLGPVWYRGYFNEPKLDSSALDQLLAQMQVRRIIVGHTTMDGVYSHYDGRVISIDSGIKGGVSGEMLFWENNQLHKAGLDGKQVDVPNAPERHKMQKIAD